MDAVEAGLRAWEEKKKESMQKLFGNDKQKQNDKAREKNMNGKKNARKLPKYLDNPTSVFPPKQTATSIPTAPIPNLNPYPRIASPSIPVHFNSKGEFIFPHPLVQTIPNPPQMIAPCSIRMCMRFGCGSILTPRNSTDEDVFCGRCRPLAAVGQFPRTVKHRRAFDVDGLLISTKKKREGVAGRSKDSPIVIPDDASGANESARMPDDLSYPEPEVTIHNNVELAPAPAPPAPVIISIPQLPTVPRWPPPPLPKMKKIVPAPLRPCTTPNCSGLIHASSAAHRCPACVMKDWKNRIKGKEREKRERVGIIIIPAKRKRDEWKPSEPTRPSTSVPSTTAPPPEKESTSGWDSDLTDLSSSDEESPFAGINQRRMADSGHSGDTTSEDDEPLPQSARQVRPPAQPVKLVIRIPPRGPEKIAAASAASSSVASSSSATPDPQRRCVIDACAAPLDHEYAWKCCKSCRKHHREYQRKRLGITKGTYNLDKEEKSLSPKPDEQNLPPGYRTCTIRHCSTVIPPVEAYKWKMCTGCRQRTKMLRKRRQEGVEVEATNSEPFRRRARNPAYPEYGSFPQLLSDYQQRLRGFFEAQAEWIIIKYQQENSKRSNTKKDDEVDRYSSMDQQDTGGAWQEKTMTKEGELFGFDGEYSVVALDYAICDRQAAVIDFVGRLKGEMERVGGVAFDPRTRHVTLAYGGILTRYRCVHRIHVTMHDRAEKIDDIRIIKDMHGELEIATLPEYSHPLFPGQRTVVRMRLMG
ncbi:uncharacterized protein BT62DRAFT_211871 [Guyanagaster necrorhizus]|uniref:Uncharacterized protein n=1 Tax=Guyanagaster necrorhizus TaxID=856835 RepID=A0A9P7VQV4_9AGAR|nr:uncharacterized protein BT62DRAFT_211871 [Guyanagaster necrorhizus MCA 3950]KAG7445142.1 hypothetical protein BT62DRAFT_211871 [Guyanagaster necrorhizus MCA 3950]